METQKTETPIDAVRLVRRIRDAHYEELREVSREDRIAFYNSKVRDPQSGADHARKPVA